MLKNGTKGERGERGGGGETDLRVRGMGRRSIRGGCLGSAFVCF